MPGRTVVSIAVAYVRCVRCKGKKVRFSKSSIRLTPCQQAVAQHVQRQAVYCDNSESVNAMQSTGRES